jgi:hypothetical protein
VALDLRGNPAIPRPNQVYSRGVWTHCRNYQPARWPVRSLAEPGASRTSRAMVRRRRPHRVIMVAGVGTMDCRIFRRFGPRTGTWGTRLAADRGRTGLVCPGPCCYFDPVNSISKWARALRYAARSKKSAVRLGKLMKEAGGVNACANRYAKYQGRMRRAIRAQGTDLRQGPGLATIHAK